MGGRAAVDRADWCQPLRTMALVVALAVLSDAVARADRVTMADGRVIEGRFVNLTGVAVDPVNGATAGSVPHILMCDDDLTRIFVPRRKVDKIDAAPPNRIEHFKLEQEIVENGLPVAALGPIIREDKFDERGRRIFSFMTKGGAVNVIQGLTEITPRWSKVESLNPRGAGAGKYIWDMRIATSSIPRDTLTKILLAQIDPKNFDDRLKLVRFYMQAERFGDAEAELKQVIQAFKGAPNADGLEQLAKDLRQLGAERILSEIAVRQKAGQYNLAYSMLQNFPADNMPGVVLQAVRDKSEQLTALQKRGVDSVNQLEGLVGQIKSDGIKRDLAPVVAEIHKELNFSTLDRLATFRRLADDNTMLPEQRLSLAISGWLIGDKDAIDNVQTVQSLIETRNRVRQYLGEPLAVTRRQILSGLVSESGAAPKYVAALLANMKPPVATPEQDNGQPGLYRLEIRGIENEPDVSYLVQLPPEYDPYKKYPAIVTLHAGGTTAEQQIDWWAGSSPAADEAARLKAAEKPLEKPANPPPKGNLFNGGTPSNAAGFAAMGADWAQAHRFGQERSVVALDVRTGRLAPQPLQSRAKAIVRLVAASEKDVKAAGKAPPPEPKPEAKPQGGGIINRLTRLGQATRNGFIVIAPDWTKPHQNQYEYSAREHAAVLGALRDACRRFSIDTDRVFLSGHSIGGDAAWDIALAHPDLWAGVIPIGSAAAKYIHNYWTNAERLSFYFVTGELDGGKTVINAPQWDRYLAQPTGWDTTIVEYEGRGHEHFSDEILRIFDWMGRKQRDFFPKGKWGAVTMRNWDNFFWCIELSDMPQNRMVEPNGWPLPRGTTPLKLEARTLATNGIDVTLRGPKITAWLAPELVDFTKPINVTINGQRATPKTNLKPDLAVMLEDVRTRGDRQHPFWAKVEGQ